MCGFGRHGKGTQNMRLEEELAFLEQHGPVIQLRNTAGGSVLVSPQYQGRVMTSAVSRGADSLGWVNRKFIEAAKTGTPFDNYGGEDRFWLGPEGGQFSIFFASGESFVFDSWRVPKTLQEDTWDILEQQDSFVTVGNRIEFFNYSNSRFLVDVRRRISLLGAGDLDTILGVMPASGVDWV